MALGRPDKTKGLAEGLIVLQSVVYGFGDTISKIAFDAVPVYSMMTVRYSFAFFVCLLLFRRRIAETVKTVPLRKWLIPGLCIGMSYPLTPSQLALVNLMTIGIPSFFLAMEPNYVRVEGTFLKNVLKSALPGGLTDLICILLTQFAAYQMGLSQSNTATLCAAVVAVTGIAVLFTVSRPFRPFRAVLLVTMAAALVGSFTLLGSFFDLTLTGGDAYWLLAGILLATPTVFWGIRKLFAPKR
jgi:hypothetical protein